MGFIECLSLSVFILCMYSFNECNAQFREFFKDIHRKECMARIKPELTVYCERGFNREMDGNGKEDTNQKMCFAYHTLRSCVLNIIDNDPTKQCKEEGREVAKQYLQNFANRISWEDCISHLGDFCIHWKTLADVVIAITLVFVFLIIMSFICWRYYLRGKYPGLGIKQVFY